MNLSDVTTLYRTNDKDGGASPNEFGHALAIGKGPMDTFAISIISGETRGRGGFAIVTREELTKIRDVLNRELAS